MNNYIDEAIKKRSESKNSLNVSTKKICRSVDILYSGIPFIAKNALYVGVGHGHDAIIALLNNKVEMVTGVDPYFEGHGNTESDYRELLHLIDAYSLETRFIVRREKIEEYLENQGEGSYDLIIANDVFHHIYETTKPLSKSDLYIDAVQLFKKLKVLAADNCMLVLGEVQRYGLIPLLKNIGFQKNSSINYRTKQSIGEWKNLITAAGWSYYKLKYYVPYQLRKYEVLFSNFLIGPLVIKRFHIYFKK